MIGSSSSFETPMSAVLCALCGVCGSLTSSSFCRVRSRYFWETYAFSLVFMLEDAVAAQAFVTCPRRGRGCSHATQSCQCTSRFGKQCRSEIYHAICVDKVDRRRL